MRLLSTGLIWAFVRLTTATPAAAQAALSNHDFESDSPLTWPHLPRYFTLPSLKEQAAIQDAWTQERIDSIPNLLRKHNVSAWLISQREYAEDTLFWSLKSAIQFSARRRTTQLFLAEPKTTKPYHTWITNKPDEDLWPELRAILDAEQPASIAVNADVNVSFASGIRAGELEALRQGLGEEWSPKLASVPPMIATEVIGTMVESKAIWYMKLMSTAWAMISEAFSERVIRPGVTTTTDVEWWLREKIQQMNFTTWFHPDVTIVQGDMKWFGAAGRETIVQGDMKRFGAEGRETIVYGDMLHVDFGVTALGMNTDTQHLGYVLYPGETEDDVPKEFVKGLKKANRMQDIVKGNMKVGTTGNDILKKCLEQMAAEGIKGKVYSHPIGDWGHSAGTLIGMTNLQEGVPVLGDFPLLPNTFYSIELMAEHFIPERNATFMFPLEEDVRFDDGGGWSWVYRRQEQFHLVKTPKTSLQVQDDL